MSVMDPEQLFLAHLGTIERIAAFICRQNHVDPDEAKEFAAEVKLRLLDDDYAVIRKYEGRSAFPTYLTTVIHRLFQERRIEQWGKWRPSAEARRLGDKAIALERLITRDGFTYAEAVQVLTTPEGSPFTVSEIEAIYLRLPPRQPRATLVSDDDSPVAVATHSSPDDGLHAGETERTARKATATVDGVLGEMEAEDQIILRMRFWHARRVAEIAQALGLDQKKTYKRIDRLLARMREALELAGVGRTEIADLLVRADRDIRFTNFAHAIGKSDLSPSHPVGGDAEDGASRLHP